MLTWATNIFELEVLMKQLLIYRIYSMSLFKEMPFSISTEDGENTYGECPGRFVQEKKDSVQPQTDLYISRNSSTWLLHFCHLFYVHQPDDRCAYEHFSPNLQPLLVL